MSTKVETVPCKFCGTPTRMTTTKQCDRCWEVRVRLQYLPKKVLELIMQDLEEFPHSA